MRRTAFLLAVLLVLVAGVGPAAAGLVRGFRTDVVHLKTGERIEGAAAERADGVRVATRDGTREIPPGEWERVDYDAAWTTDHLVAVLGDETGIYGQALVWTLAIALAGTLGAVFLGVPFALLTARTDLPGRRWFAGLYGAPLVLPPLLTALAWSEILPVDLQLGSKEGGRAFTALQAALLFSLAYFPFVTLFTRRSLAAVGSAAEEAALLAAGPRRALFRVTLPLARPGILLGALFAFIFCLNDFSVVDFLNVVLTNSPGRMVTVYPFLVQSGFSRTTGSVGELMVLGIPFALLSLGALFAALRIAFRTPVATVGTAWRPPRTLALGPAGKAAGALFCVLLLAVAVVLPAAKLAAWAGGPASYRTVFGSDLAREALRNSLGITFGAALLAVPVALILAEAGRRISRGAEVLGAALVLAPLALVPSLVPIGAMGLWDRPWLLFTRNDAPWNPVYDTALLTVLVVFARVLPFTLAATWASMKEVEPSLHEAAAVAGVPWDIRLRRVVLPLVRPGVVLGGILAVVFSLRELDGIAVLKTAPTLLQKLWSDMHFARDRSVAVQSVVLLVLMALVFAVAAALGWLRPRGQDPAAASRSSSAK